MKASAQRRKSRVQI
jgi:chlorite dismutase